MQYVNEFDKKRRQHGRWQQEYSNHILSSRYHYIHGLKIGIEIKWDNKGTIIMKRYNLVIK